VTAGDDEDKQRRLSDVQRALSAVEARRRHDDDEPAEGLGERLMQSRAKLAGDLRALAELSGPLDRPAAAMQAMRAKAAPEPVAVARRSPRLFRRLLLAFALAIAATGVVLLWLASRGEQHPANPAQGPSPPGQGS